MKNRTTFALDDDSIKRLHALAELWHVSQAEVIRRALTQAEQNVRQPETNPLEQLEQYHKKQLFSQNQANEYLLEVAENRSDWGRKE